MAIFISTLFALIFLFFIIKNELNRPKKDYEELCKEAAIAKRHTDKVAKKKEFENQLKIYSGTVSSFLSEAIKNQNYSESLDVNFRHVIEAFSSGDPNKISNISSKILTASDKSLTELAKHFDAFRGLVANLPIENQHYPDYRHPALGAAHLLGEISHGHCRCRTYNDFNNFMPSSAAEMGDIEILEETFNEETYSTDYYYKCIRCGATTEANVNWDGHAPYTILRGYNSKP
tara:strand:- start:269 stop:964 length:696 start_codon:yes stop_codon:yes gene_type:complete